MPIALLYHIYHNYKLKPFEFIFVSNITINSNHDANSIFVSNITINSNQDANSIFVSYIITNFKLQSIQNSLLFVTNSE